MHWRGNEHRRVAAPGPTDASAAPDHVIITRFNQCLTGIDQPERRLDPDWLAGRFDLFERICLPSVRAAAAALRSEPAGTVRWLVLFDAATPEPWGARARALADDLVEPVFTAEPFSAESVAAMVGPRCRSARMITTRLDSDDAIAPWFLARVRQAAPSSGRVVVSLPMGAQVTQDRYVARTYLQNPFLSMVEDTAGCTTVFSVKHYDLRGMAVRYVWTPPAWLQSVHGGNLRNEVRGVRIGGRAVHRSFAGSGVDLAPEAPATEWVPAAVTSGARYTVQAARRLPAVAGLARRAAVEEAEPAPVTAAPAAAFTLGDVRIDVRSMDDAIDELLTGHGPRAVHLCNAYTVALAAQDRGLARCLDHGDLSLADGMPVVWVARLLGFRRMTERVYGPALMEGCLDRGRGAGTRHALFGSTPEVIESLAAAITRRWPGAEIVWTESPPFRELSDAEVADAARSADAAGADLVWVGIGTPRQDFMVERLRAHGGATYVAVGAAFDFLAGHKRQAPGWMGDHGLEWLFRLVTEPRRLAKRYLVGNVQFLAALVRKPPRRLDRSTS